MLTPGRMLTALANQPVLRWIGLMSGTSCDGIDAALLEVQERGGELPHAVVIAGTTRPFPAEVEKELLADLQGVRSAEKLALWDARLGAAFAEAAVALMGEHGPADAIALSGHTFAHLPAGRPVSTLQLGNPASVARRTRLPVVAGFRAADVANGGEGAPLVPAGDRIMFGHLGGDLAVVNLGGISNVTWLGADGNPPLAADCGPSNLILNKLARDGSDGALPYDKDGTLALDGKADKGKVASWMKHPFFAEARRSTGREEFGENWVNEHRPLLAKMSLPDQLATAVEWIAQSVAHTVGRLSAGSSAGGKKPRRLLVGGGGAHNRAVTAALARAVGVKAERLERAPHGIDGDLREAAAFAILGNEWLRGRPGSFPTTTGCKSALPIGALWI